MRKIKGHKTEEAPEPQQGEAIPAGTEQSQPAGTQEPQPAGTDDQPKEVRIAEWEKKVSSLEDSLLRAKADYQNLQRRAAIERSEAIRYANAELMKAILPVLDDLERAMTAAEGIEHAETIAEGIRLVYSKFLKTLGDHGLEQMDALGKEFDPSVHEALMRQPSAELPPGMVIQEAAKGYKLGDRVLRPAKVIVAQAAEEKQIEPPGADAGAPGPE